MAKKKNDFQYGGWNSYTLQCGMWLRNCDSEFTKWQHPAMWYWDDMPSNSPKRLPYWNSTSGFHFDHITAVDMSLITSCRFSRWRISAILEFRDPIMCSLKSPCTTSYRSSIETIALNYLVFEKIAFLQFGDRQTNKQTNRRTDGHARRMKPLSLSRAAA